MEYGGIPPYGADGEKQTHQVRQGVLSRSKAGTKSEEVKKDGRWVRRKNTGDREAR